VSSATKSSSPTRARSAPSPPARARTTATGVPGDRSSSLGWNDAEKLARFAACDPKLLSPIQHRSPQRQQDLNLIHARSTLVRARTMLVNALRGLVKSAGGRLRP